MSNQITVVVGDQLRQQLTAYLNLGLPIIPICPPTHRGMSLTRREQCKSLGKTPLIKNWPTRTETTFGEVNEWLQQFPNCNWGLPLGNASGLVGIDVDGELGERLLGEWSQGDLPPTWSFSTKSGRRLLYAIPEGVRVRKYRESDKDAIHQELALLGDGQQTVVPPSVHPTGYVYAWDTDFSPMDIPMPSLAPKWILDRMCSPVDRNGNVEYSEQVKSNEWTEDLKEGNRSQQLTRLVGSLVARGTMPKEAVLDFVTHWNQKHCKPPLALDEVKRMVEYVWMSEQSSDKKGLKKGRTKKEDEVKFLATPIAKKILIVEKEKGFLWKYIESKGMFFYYDQAIGYWKEIPKEYLGQRIRRYLVETHEEWDSVKHINETVAAMRDLLIDPADEDYFDLGKYRNLKLLNVQNGMLDWRTGEVGLHDSKYYSLIQLPVEFDPEATCPKWLEALEQWLPDFNSRLFLQEFVGYCLVPDTSYKTAVFLHGGGNNGKSMFLHAVARLLGEEATTVIPLHGLSERFTITTLQNKLLNVCDEIDGTYLSETGILKALISGDPVKAEYKYGKSFFFTPVLKMLFSTNVLPRSGDRSEGWYSRFRFVVFPNRFSVNQSYKAKMHGHIEEEINGILNWAIEGLKRLDRNGAFTDSEVMQRTAMEYRAENDSAVAFAEECLEYKGIEPTTRVPSAAMYAFYCDWCSEGGLKPVSIREFSARLRGLGIDKGARPTPGDPKSRSNCYLGVRIKNDWIKNYNYSANIAMGR